MRLAHTDCPHCGEPVRIPAFSRHKHHTNSAFFECVHSEGIAQGFELDPYHFAHWHCPVCFYPILVVKPAPNVFTDPSKSVVDNLMAYRFKTARERFVNG